jgi:hypothetical protein
MATKSSVFWPLRKEKKELLGQRNKFGVDKSEKRKKKLENQ